MVFILAKKLYVVGLGPGRLSDISLESLELLKSIERVILRTEQHPGVSELQEHGIQYISCDSFYEQNKAFEDVYNEISDFCLQELDKYPEIVYAVPGSPMVAEKTVQILLQKQKEFDNIIVEVLPAMSFLDSVYAKVQIDPCDGLQVVDALQIEELLITGSIQMIITQIYNNYVASDVKLKLMEVYPDETPIVFMRNLGAPDERVVEIPLYELDRQKDINHLTTLYVPALEQQQSRANTTELECTMQKLRSPEGCMWDREQNHATIRQNFIEEVYEAIEAIDLQDSELLCEELGDVLLQIVFHAQMANEAGLFSLQDVIDGINTKLIRRHPHVFGEITVANSKEIVYNWEQIKKTEKKATKSVLDGVPAGLPALMVSHKLQSKAAKIGFDWDSIEPVYAKVLEEIEEVRNAVDEQELEKELGDLLFAVVNLSRHLGVSPEIALNTSNRSFKNRFYYIEQRIRSEQKDWQDFSLEQLDILWEEAKSQERFFKTKSLKDK